MQNTIKIVHKPFFSVYARYVLHIYVCLSQKHTNTHTCSHMNKLAKCWAIDLLTAILSEILDRVRLKDVHQNIPFQWRACQCMGDGVRSDVHCSSFTILAVSKSYHQLMIKLYRNFSPRLNSFIPNLNSAQHNWPVRERKINKTP